MISLRSLLHLGPSSAVIAAWESQGVAISGTAATMPDGTTGVLQIDGTILLSDGETVALTGGAVPDPTKRPVKPEGWSIGYFLDFQLPELEAKAKWTSVGAVVGAAVGAGLGFSVLGPLGARIGAAVVGSLGGYLGYKES